MVRQANTIHLRPRLVLLGLGTAIFLLSATGIITQLLRIELKMRPVGLIAAFDLNREANVPTLFSVLLLLLSGLLLRVIATFNKERRDPFSKRWLLLSWIFFYMAIDEGVGIHELCIRPLRSALDAGGIFYFAWVIPALAVLLLLGVYFFRFVMQLKSSYRNGIVGSGLVYVTGALGMEMLGGSYYESIGRKKDFAYCLFTAAEETLEMAGLAIFIYILLIYVEQQLGGFHVLVGNVNASSGKTKKVR